MSDLIIDSVEFIPGPEWAQRLEPLDPFHARAPEVVVGSLKGHSPEGTEFKAVQVFSLEFYTDAGEDRCEALLRDEAMRLASETAPDPPEQESET